MNKLFVVPLAAAAVALPLVVSAPAGDASAAGSVITSCRASDSGARVSVAWRSVGGSKYLAVTAPDRVSTPSGVQSKVVTTVARGRQSYSFYPHPAGRVRLARSTLGTVTKVAVRYTGGYVASCGVTTP